MAKLDFFYEGKKVNEDIANWRDLEIELDIQDISGTGNIKAGSLEFVNGIAQKINSWNESGLNGSPGIFEAPPFRIEVCGGGDVVFDGGVNTADCATEYQCDRVLATIRESGGIDFLNDRANSFSFAYLASLPAGSAGRITQADYVLVPYVVNSIPDYLNVITGIISLFVLVKELEQAVEKTAVLVAELIGDISLAIGTLGLGAGVVIADILKLIYYIAYVIILIIAIIDLVALIFISLVQPTKYKKGITVIKLMQRASEYLGLNFSSTLLLSPIYKGLMIIPKKTAFNTNQTEGQTFVTKITNLSFNIKQYDDAKHSDTYGYFEGTFTDLLMGMGDVLNAKPTLIKDASGNSTLHFERVDYFQKQPQYTLPDIKFAPNQTNACELKANYYLTFALDPIEANTYDLFEGTNCQHITSPIVVNKPQNILLGGLDERRLIFAKANPKKKNTPIEDIFNAIYNVANLTYEVFSYLINVVIDLVIRPRLKILNSILNVVGLPTINTPSLPLFPTNPVGNRIGFMLLSNDFIGVPKLLILNLKNGTIGAPNDTYLSAAYLIDNFHFINFPICLVDSNRNPKNEHNQWLIYKNKEVPLCCGDYVAIKNNSYIKTKDGRIGKVDSLVWKPYRETAVINFRIKQQYTKNLKEQYLIAKN